MTTRAGAIEKVQPKESVDWDAIYAAYLPRVYNFFRYRIGPGPQAEDLTAATFEKAWRARQSYRRDLAAFSTWLFTIARHIASDYLRRRAPEVPLDALSEQAGDDTPEEHAAKRADVERLALLLADLDTLQRELLALKYGAGLTNREIAKLVNLSESNVGTILFRLVRELRARWEEKQ